MDWTKPFLTSKIDQYFKMALDQAVNIVPRLMLAFLLIWDGLL